MSEHTTTAVHAERSNRRMLSTSTEHRSAWQGALTLWIAAQGALDLDLELELDLDYLDLDLDLDPDWDWDWHLDLDLDWDWDWD